MKSKELQDLFKERNYTLALAESCTGGNIAHQLTLISGSSEYFLGSVTAYSNSVKRNVLGVSEKDLNNFGAVSEPVAIHMAAGIKKLLNSDYSCSTTGIAGPTGGNNEKPVGTVWIGISGPNGTKAKKYLFTGDRESIIAQATNQAILDVIKIVETDIL